MSKSKALNARRLTTFASKDRLIRNDNITKTATNKTIIKSLDKIPGPMPSLPFFGTSWQYWPIVGKYDLFKIHDVMREKFEKYGPIFKEEYQRGKAIVNICDPRDIETVFRSQGKCPIRPANEFVKQYRNRLPNYYPSVGIANLNGKEWYEKRQLLIPVLRNLDTIQYYFDNQRKICDDLIDYSWRESKQSEINSEHFIMDDFRTVSYKFALESISCMCLGTRFGCLGQSHTTNADGIVLVNATKSLFEAHQKLFYSIPLWKYVPTKSYRQFCAAESAIYETLSKYVCAALHSDRKQPENCLMRELLKIDKLSVNEVKVMLMDFIIGGLFTVANALNFVCYHLARNAVVQQTLHREISLFVDSPLSPEPLSRLAYTKACIKESFRLTSTIPGIVRILPDDVVLSGYRVPAGTLIFSNLMTTSRSEQNFADANSFLPDRWIGESKKSIHPFSTLPFGFGGRMCPGRRFAQLQLEMAIFYIVKNFHLSTDSDSEIDLVCKFLIVPNHDIKLLLRKRI